MVRTTKAPPTIMARMMTVPKVSRSSKAWKSVPICPPTGALIGSIKAYSTPKPNAVTRVTATCAASLISATSCGERRRSCRRPRPLRCRSALAFAALRGNFGGGRRLHFAQQLAPELGQKFGTMLTLQFSLQFLQGQRDNVVVVQSAVLRVGGHLQPDAVQKLQVLLPQTGGMRAQRIYTRATVGESHFQFQARTRLGETLPGIAGQLALFI